MGVELDVEFHEYLKKVLDTKKKIIPDVKKKIMVSYDKLLSMEVKLYKIHDYKKEFKEMYEQVPKLYFFRRTSCNKDFFNVKEIIGESIMLLITDESEFNDRTLETLKDGSLITKTMSGILRKGLIKGLYKKKKFIKADAKRLDYVSKILYKEFNNLSSLKQKLRALDDAL